MSRRKRTSLSTAQIMVLLLVVLAIGAVLAVVFAPRKPPAPPVSSMQVAERPADKVGAPAAMAPAADPAPAPVASPTPDAAPASTSATEETLEPVGAYRVTGTIKEKDTQKPISGVVVLAIKTAEEEGAEPLSYRAVSNNAGEFVIGVADSGSYSLVVPGRDELPEQRRHIAKFETTLGTIDASRPSATQEVLLDLKAMIQGKVTETGSSTPAQEVSLALLDSTAKNVLGTTTTYADGTFEIAVDNPGDYAVRVDLEKSPYRMGNLVPFRRVKVPDADSIVENVDFQVDPAGIVWGYVTTPDGEPVADTDVVLATAESPLTQFVTAALRRTPPISNKSQGDGYYELIGVPLNEEYQLYATSNSKAPQLAKPFVLTSATRSLQVNIFMFPGSRVTGTVVDNRGQRIPNARIRCVPDLTTLSSPLQNAFAFRDVRADGDGVFVLEEVPAGGYNLYAQQKGYKFDTTGTPIYPDGYSELTGVDVVLYPIEAGSHDIFGIVVDPTGEPISGVEVDLRGLALDSMTRVEQSATTSASGEFRFSNMPGGRYGAVFTKEAYGTVRRSGLALDRENRVLMSQASVVRGRVVVRETNQPPANYTVQAVKTAAYSESNTRTVAIGGGNEQVSGSFSNPDGSFELFLSAGEYMLMGSSEGLTSGRAFASVEPGVDVNDVVITLSQTGGVIAGVVKTMDGNSPQGGTARLVDTSGGIIGAIDGENPINTEYVLGEDGAFRFEQLPAGSYIVNVEHPTYAKASSDPITLGDGEQRTDIEIRLGNGGVLTGRVCTSQGEPWAGAQIFVASAESQDVRDAVADETGYFQIDGLASGEYQVTATAIGGTGAGAIGGLLGGGDILVRSVRVTEGQTSEVDFCAPGIKLTGVCSPGPPGALQGLGMVFLRPPGSPWVADQLSGNVGEDILQQMTVMGGNRIDPTTGVYEIPGLNPGTYQIEVVYVWFFGGEGGAQSVAQDYIELPADVTEYPYDPAISADEPGVSFDEGDIPQE